MQPDRMSETQDISFVLLADDDDDDTTLFVEAAEQLSTSIKVSLAGDGQKLLKLLEESYLPDIIFLDLNMPFKNGLECLKVIRENPKYDKVPVIIYSTSQNKRDIETCYKAGATYYVIKPNSFEDIVSVLRHLFSTLVKTDTLVADKSGFVIDADKQSFS